MSLIDDTYERRCRHGIHRWAETACERCTKEEREATVPAPSDEAVNAAGNALGRRLPSLGYRREDVAQSCLDAAYAIDLPALLAEARAEGEAARTAEIERLRDALDFITGGSDRGPWVFVYREAGGGYEGLQAIAREALKESERPQSLRD